MRSTQTGLPIIEQEEQHRLLKWDLVSIITSINGTITTEDKQQAQDYYEQMQQGCGACDLQTIQTYVEQLKYGGKQDE